MRHAPDSWKIVDANFCANSAPDARVFGSLRPIDSMQHFCDVKKFSKRRRPKVWCVARRRTENLQTNLRIFWRKNCAISAPNARFFGAQHRAESHWSCAEVLRFKKLNLWRKKREICAPRSGIVGNLQQIWASSTQIFVRVRRRTRAFSAAHAPSTRCNIFETSQNFRNDAGRSFGALCVEKQKFDNEFAHFLAEQNSEKFRG